MEGTYDKTRLKKYSKYATDLIEKLLEKDIKKRIRAEDALKHKWFQVYKSKEILIDIEDPQLIQRYLKNLKNFKCSSAIQEIALAYLVHNNPELEEVDNACKLFSLIDRNGNGKITKEDLMVGLQNLIDGSTLRNDIDDIFDNLDSDKNGYLEYEEFVRAAIDKTIFINDNSIKIAFNYFDRNSDGVITADEICDIFNDFFEGDEEEAAEEDKIRKIIEEVDLNKDGKIQFEEFTEVMKKLIM